jgi:hypothetical protein
MDLNRLVNEVTSIFPVPLTPLSPRGGLRGQVMFGKPHPYRPSPWRHE